ncbi:uncharacterized protein J3D65DRAFT_696031 [Phyllosticta citribraziliensis]|uniref:Uncharacterized protein n=1 Tax=Phyllosticta citribraziliensis TaxID=989973 RepID=A0ABR1LSS2_9PEZI
MSGAVVRKDGRYGGPEGAAVSRSSRMERGRGYHHRSVPSCLDEVLEKGMERGDRASGSACCDRGVDRQAEPQSCRCRAGLDGSKGRESTGLTPCLNLKLQGCSATSMPSASSDGALQGPRRCYGSAQLVELSVGDVAPPKACHALCPWNEFASLSKDAVCLNYEGTADPASGARQPRQKPYECPIDGGNEWAKCPSVAAPPALMKTTFPSMDAVWLNSKGTADPASGNRQRLRQACHDALSMVLRYGGLQVSLRSGATRSDERRLARPWTQFG